jgi:FXSXX-COOH protein
VSGSETAAQAAGAQPLPHDEGLDHVMVDFSEVTLAELRFVEGSPIATVVARLIAEAVDPGDAIAGFDSAV